MSSSSSPSSAVSAKTSTTSISSSAISLSSSTPSVEVASPAPFAMPSLPSLNSIVRWCQRKNYQYEVTFAIYMLTPTEKCIFNTLLLTLFTLGLTATYIYLPNSLLACWHKCLYYCMGDASASSLANSTKEGVISLGGNVSEGLGSLFMQKGPVAASAAATASAAGQRVL